MMQLGAEKRPGIDCSRAHAQEFRLFYGYFTVYFTTNDGQNPVLWTRHSTARCNLNTKQFPNQPEPTKMINISDLPKPYYTVILAAMYVVQTVMRLFPSHNKACIARFLKAAACHNADTAILLEYTKVHGNI